MRNIVLKKVFKCVLYSTVISGAVLASSTPPKTIGSIATSITGSFSQIGQLIFGIAYVAGLGFGVAAVFKFKQHKDNPTQVPIGTPVSLIAISAALVFLPSFYNPLGQTMGVDGAGGFKGGGVSNLPGGAAAAGGGGSGDQQSDQQGGQQGGG